jgi:hypothetical protein
LADIVYPKPVIPTERPRGRQTQTGKWGIFSHFLTEIGFDWVYPPREWRVYSYSIFAKYRNVSRWWMYMEFSHKTSEPKNEKRKGKNAKS